MNRFCNKRGLSPLQRQSVAGFSAMVAVGSSTSLLVHNAMAHEHLSRASIYGLALLAAVPVAVQIFFVGRYLSRETDEFVRMLVVQALLWGLGATIILDTVYSYLAEFAGFARVNGMLQTINVEFFCLASAIALGLLARRYR